MFTGPVMSPRWGAWTHSSSWPNTTRKSPEIASTEAMAGDGSIGTLRSSTSAKQVGSRMRVGWSQSLFLNLLAPEWGRSNVAWGVSPRICRYHLVPYPGAARGWGGARVKGGYRRWDSPSWGSRPRLH